MYLMECTLMEEVESEFSLIKLALLQVHVWP